MLWFTVGFATGDEGVWMRENWEGTPGTPILSYLLYNLQGAGYTLEVVIDPSAYGRDRFPTFGCEITLAG